MFLQKKQKYQNFFVYQKEQKKQKYQKNTHYQKYQKKQKYQKMFEIQFSFVFGDTHICCRQYECAYEYKCYH